MKGNFHVQFLGEGVAATSPPYPTPGWATTPVYPAQVPFKLAPMARSRLLVSRSLKKAQHHQLARSTFPPWCVSKSAVRFRRGKRWTLTPNREQVN